MSHYQNFTPPFPIPDSWEWVRLEEIGEIITGNTPSKDIKSYYGGNIPFYKPTDLDQGINTSHASDTLSDEGYNISRKIPTDSVLVTCIGATIGKTGRILNEGSCNQQINAIIPDSHVLSKFLYFVCVSDYFQSEIKKNASATTLPILNKNNFSLLYMPLPPQKEQERIVEEIEHLRTIIDCVDLDCKLLGDTISSAKSKILELAMQGKLVPQDPAVESAADMLRRVNSKARIITDNPHSWNIPKSWVWIQMGDVFLHNTGKALNNSNSEGTVYEYITTSNVYWGRFELDILKSMPFKDSEIDKCKIAKGDLLVCEGGDVGRAAIWRYDMPMMIQNHLHRLRPFSKDILPDFYFYILKMFKDRDLIGGKGIALQGFSSNALHKLVVPLPPIREQKRIVIKIKEFWNVLDEIEASLQS